MARQGKIVPFDEAARGRSARSGGARSGAAHPNAGRRSGGASHTQGDTRRRGQASGAREELVGRQGAGQRRVERTSRTVETRRRGSAQPGAKTAAQSTQRTQRTQRTQQSERSQKQRARAKQRADKQFTRLYADAAPSAASSEGAPRAALYKGEMGARQRRAAQMQRVSEAGPVSAKINPAGWFSGLNVSARAARAVTAVLCVLLTCVFLYTPAQQYYQSVRERDRLQVEYAAIEQRNEVLDQQNDALASDAGIEDAVRQKYGYVMPGEQVAVVSGLSEEATTHANDSASIEPAVLSSGVKAPEKWYTPFLDAFFGVE